MFLFHYFLSFLDKNFLFLSLRFFDLSSLNLDLSDELLRLDLKICTLLKIFLLLRYIVGFLGIIAVCLTLDFLGLSNSQLLLVSLFLLGIFLGNNRFLFLDFTFNCHLGVRGAFFIATLAACSTSVGFRKLDI